MPGQIEGQALEASPERAGQHGDQVRADNELPFRKTTARPLPLALQERDLLTINSDLHMDGRPSHQTGHATDRSWITSATSPGSISCRPWPGFVQSRYGAAEVAV
jgi:hypothetical protein